MFVVCENMPLSWVGLSAACYGWLDINCHIGSVYKCKVLWCVSAVYWSSQTLCSSVSV